MAPDRHLLLTCVSSRSGRITNGEDDPWSNCFGRELPGGMDGGLLASRTLLTNLCEEKQGLGTPLPVYGHPSHQLFCFLAVPERFGPVSHGWKCHTYPHQLPTSIHHRQRFVFLLWKLETFRREIKFSLGNPGGRRVEGR